MSRAELWAALAEATDAVQAAVEEYGRAPTPRARAARDAVFREYVKRLSPLIGQAEALAFEVSLHAYQALVARVEQLHATLRSGASLDVADRTLMQQLVGERAEAGKTFEAAMAALSAVLERSRARDSEPDEKSGA